MMQWINPYSECILQCLCLSLRVFAQLGVGALFLVLTGCAAWQIPAEFDDAELRARAQTASVSDIRLSATVLSAEENRRIFGADINETGVQSVWIEVKNHTSQTLWLLRTGTDPDYFSPHEVAWSFHRTFSGKTNAKIDEHFRALGFKNPIAPGQTQAGIIFTNPHRQTRLLNVDLLGYGKMIPFTLFLPVPDDAPNERAVEIVKRFSHTKAADYQDEGKFRAALEQMPCCATGPGPTASGDPLNVIVVGEFANIASAFVRRSFRTEGTDNDNMQRVFGRPPDVVLRKAGQGGVPTNWIRMWVAPLRYQGRPVFLGQTGRPVGGRFALWEGKDLLLHPNVDEARNLLVQDLFYSGGLSKFGFAAGVGEVLPAQPRVSLANTHYYTDGLRAVFFLTTRPITLSDVQILDWVHLEQREVDLIQESGIQDK